MTPSKKTIGLVTCATGVVLASLAFGPAANAASLETPNATAPAASSSTNAVSAPELSIVSQSSGVVQVGVRAAAGSLVRFQDDTRRTTVVGIPQSGYNTVFVRVDDDRLTTFTVTSVLDGETLETPWSVDTRDQTPADPGNPGTGDAPTVVVAGYAHGYATLAVTGPAGKTYSVTDAAGTWAGSGRLGSAPARVSVAAPEGAVTTYTVTVADGLQVVGSTTVDLDPSGTEPEQPVAPSPEPVDPGEGEGPQDPQVPVDPGTPTPEQPGDQDGSVVGDVTVGAVANGRAAVTISGPIGAQWMITGEGDTYVTGGFIEGHSITRSIVVGAGSVKTFTLHMAGGTKTFTVVAR